MGWLSLQGEAWSDIVPILASAHWEQSWGLGYLCTLFIGKMLSKEREEGKKDGAGEAAEQRMCS
jgi:hypothetical protein